MRTRAMASYHALPPCRRRVMKTTPVIGLIAFFLVVGTHVTGQTDQHIAIDPDDIGGIASSSKGPEAGVWVIAETTDLPTKFRKIAVTDDAGRFVIPDLPDAKYKVWVRGYGLIDSEPVQATRGRQLSLKAVLAPNARAAAQYYPSDYWLSLIQIPPKSDFPMTVNLPP